MLRATDVVGLGSAACLAAAVLLSLPGVARLRMAWPVVTLIAALALALIPIAALPAAGYVRGVIGDLSVTTTLLLLHHLLRPVLRLRPIDERSRIALQALVATVAVLLYPPTLGFGAVDPYRFGFAHAGLVCALLLLVLLAWFVRLHFVASVLAVAVLAWAVGTGESRNLWDYLLDPLASAWALAALAWRLARTVRRPLAASSEEG